MTDTSREALIKNLRLLETIWGGHAGDIGKQAADMLEADANWEQVARAQDAKLRAMAGEPGGIEKLREVLDGARAQQVAVPMTNEQRRSSWIAATFDTPSGENCYLRGLADAERHHKIGAK